MNSQSFINVSTTGGPESTTPAMANESPISAMDILSDSRADWIRGLSDVFTLRRATAPIKFISPIAPGHANWLFHIWSSLKWPLF